MRPKCQILKVIPNSQSLVFELTIYGLESPKKEPSQPLSSKASRTGKWVERADNAGCTKKDSPITITRSFDQFCWLSQQVELIFQTLILSPIPDTPETSHFHDIEYLQYKKAQMERWFSRLAARDAIRKSVPFLHFISDSMTGSDVAITEKNGFAKLFSSIISNSNSNELIVYTPSTEISEYNEDEFSLRKKYLTDMDERMKELASDFSAVKNTTEGLATSHRAFFSEFCSLMGPSFCLGSSFPQKPTKNHKSLERAIVVLKKAHYNEISSMKDTNNFLNDHVIEVINEYRGTIKKVRRAMNYQTKMLKTYDEASKVLQKRQDQAYVLADRYPSDAGAAQEAKDMVEKLEKRASHACKEYVQSGIDVQSELLLFEQEKAQEIGNSLREFASLHRQEANQQLQRLQSYLDHIRHGTPLDNVGKPEQRASSSYSTPRASTSNSLPSVDAENLRTFVQSSEKSDSPLEELFEDLVRRGIFSTPSNTTAFPCYNSLLRSASGVSIASTSSEPEHSRPPMLKPAQTWNPKRTRERHALGKGHLRATSLEGTASSSLANKDFRLAKTLLAKRAVTPKRTLSTGHRASSGSKGKEPASGFVPSYRVVSTGSISERKDPYDPVPKNLRVNTLYRQTSSPLSGTSRNFSSGSSNQNPAFATTGMLRKSPKVPYPPLSASALSHFISNQDSESLIASPPASPDSTISTAPGSTQIKSSKPSPTTAQQLKSASDDSGIFLGTKKRSLRPINIPSPPPTCDYYKKGGHEEGITCSDYNSQTNKIVSGFPQLAINDQKIWESEERNSLGKASLSRG
ncbi:hypothetical protein H4219_000831 [Mycoemilia scoparia]|uniref:PX domain-containing protein n=1 Tax=Mycoemilia scoparia TaxID=417184 RepID=A0A9W8A514_9FUNG|nr:hypothetical protein H4219_000831 [Mycoemilia scoparia]